MVLVTPGVRPAGSDTGDQKRIMTPGRAIREGADYLVVGRPVTAAREPKAAAESIVDRNRRAAGATVIKSTEENDGQGLLGRTRRCEGRRRLQALRGRQCGDLQEVGRAFRRARRQIRERRKARARTRNVVIEFPDVETALACYHSPEYQANIKVREPHSIADIIIIEGYDGPQPADS